MCAHKLATSMAIFWTTHKIVKLSLNYTVYRHNRKRHYRLAG